MTTGSNTMRSRIVVMATDIVQQKNHLHSCFKASAAIWSRFVTFDLSLLAGSTSSTEGSHCSPRLISVVRPVVVETGSLRANINMRQGNNDANSPNVGCLGMFARARAFDPGMRMREEASSEQLINHP